MPPIPINQEWELIQADSTTLARFTKFVKVNLAGCWRWTGAGRTGYGNMRIGGKTYSSHRISYCLFVGPIPDGLMMLHSCDNRWCVNPNHLTPGTQLENVLQAMERGLLVHTRRQNCKNGHNDWVKNGNGVWTCGECRRLRDTKRRRDSGNPKFSEEIRGERGAYKQGEIRNINKENN